MLTTSQDVVIVAVCLLLSLLFLWLLQRIWPSSQRRQHNDIIGWQVSVLGTTLSALISADWKVVQTA